MKLGLKFILRVIHNLAKVRIPGFTVLIPLDALLRIVDAIQVGMNHPIKVDWKFSDIKGLMKFLEELMEAAVIKNETEELQAIYHLLVYVTTLEQFVTEEEFLAKARDAAHMLPSCNVTPDDDADESSDGSSSPSDKVATASVSLTI